MPSGVNASDFTNYIQADWGVSVTHTPRTSTHDPITGDETFANGTPATITVVLVRKTVRWMFDKDGEIQGGDAYCFANSTLTINKDDLITYDGNTYQVMDRIVRKLPDGTTFYTYCNLFIQA